MAHATETQSGDGDPKRVADVDTAKHDLRVLYAVIRDSRTKWYVPVLMGIVVLWGVVPIDLLPDFLPLFGVLDEAVVFLLARAAIYRIVPGEHVEEHAMDLAQRSSRRYTARHLIGGVMGIQLGVILILIVFFGFSLSIL